MPAPSDLDPLYQEWLEIPAERLPPNHYAILGLSDFESDGEEIETAAKSRGAYLHQIAAGPQRKIVQKMLGQVAIARRILMSDSARNEYDQSLRRADVCAGAAAESCELALASSHSAESVSAAGASKVSETRMKPSDWKYHAISAAALLLIVSVVFWVNRNPGGRRAAQARAAEADSLTDASSTKVTSSKPSAEPNASPERGATTSAAREPAKRTNSRKAPAVASSDSSSSRRSPIAKKRDTGSGLGMGLGSKFTDVLTDIAKQPGEDAPRLERKPGSANGFQPLAGLSVSPVKKNVKPNEWPTDLLVVDAFPDAAADRFECDRGFDWFDAREKRLHIKTISGKNVFWLADKKFKLTAGSALALTTSLASKMRSEVNVGFAIDGIRIALRPFKSGVEVIVRDRGEDARIDSVSRIKTDSAKTTLTIVRDGKNASSVHWFVKTGDQRQTGEIGVKDLGDHPNVSLFVATPKKDMSRPLWVADLMTREGAQ